jgi:hypothetical protein
VSTANCGGGASIRIPLKSVNISRSVTMADALLEVVEGVKPDENVDET